LLPLARLLVLVAALRAAVRDRKEDFLAAEAGEGVGE